MNIWPFFRSDGAGRATTRTTRGLTFSLRALMVPPLPAASRPSNKMITRSFFALTHPCRWQSCTCSLPSSFSYAFRFILGAASSLAMCHYSRSLFPFVRCRRWLAVPADGDADVARHAAGKINDLVADAIAARLQIVAPELVDFF